MKPAIFARLAKKLLCLYLLHFTPFYFLEKAEMKELIENRKAALPGEATMSCMPRMNKHVQRSLEFTGKPGRKTISPGMIAVVDAADLGCLI